MSEISAIVGSNILFDGELWVGGVAGAGDVDIDEASHIKVGGVVSLSRTEIFLRLGARGIGVSTPLLRRME